MRGQRSWWNLKPCGTYAAYRRHLRRGERIDEACKQAARLQTADRPDHRPNHHRRVA